MAIVGDAYIVVKAITAGFENDVRKAASGIDLNKDGKVTKADILKGRGVIAKKGAKIAKCKYGCN